MFTKADIESYFLAEKNAGLLFIIVGAAAIIAAIIFFFFIKTNWYKGASIPFVLIGIIQLMVGFAVYKRSDADRQRNVYAYDMNISELKEKELPRMEKVNKNFIIYHYIEIAFLLAGVSLFFIFRNESNRQMLAGIGFALAIEAVLILSADYIAAKRAMKYTNGLEEYVLKQLL